MHYRRAAAAGATYFFTLVTHERQRLFDDATNIDRWRRAVTKVQRTRLFSVDAEVILPDHLHVLWTLPDHDSDYATRIRLAKTAFTKSLDLSRSGSSNVSRKAKGERDVWQRRYWEHMIRDERDFRVHLDYIHYNPVKHGFVARATDWPWSTLRDWIDRGAYEPSWGADVLPELPEWAGRE